MSEIKHVDILDSIQPANSGTGEARLVSGGLRQWVDEYRVDHADRSARVWSAEQGSVDEEFAARQLASEYLLRTAVQLDQSPGVTDRNLWADRYTEASVELYGAPESAEAKRLAREDLRIYRSLIGNEAVSQDELTILINAYESISDQTDEEQAELAVQEKQAAEELEVALIFGEALRKEYQGLFDLVSATEKESFTPSDLYDVFSRAIDWLAENKDPSWSQWTVKMYENKTALSVDVQNREIRCPGKRATATSKDVEQLLAHELLGHALRANNGYKTSDEMLALGLPGSVDAEEGYGKFLEVSLNGELLEGMHDRYVDVALALGILDGKQRTRKQMQEIVQARRIIRAQVKGEFSVDDLPLLERKSWSYIDRSYRGGPGDELEARQAIMTKDIAYYVGYKKIARYINEQIKTGKSVESILEFMSASRIDPTIGSHVERLNSASQKV